MAESTKAQFSLPADFSDKPTEANFPRQLIIYDEDSDTWKPTADKGIIAHTRYLCVSYRQSDFPEEDRGQLELDIQAVCLLQYDLSAYWLDYACTGSTQEEKNRDLYRIADVFRGATKTLIIIKGGDYKPHSPGWISWGDRLWTLPEALLSGYSGNKLFYRAGRRKAKPITLREIANHAYKDGDREMALINAYGGEPVIGPDVMFESLVKAIWNRSSGSAKGKEKEGAFTAYEAERVYALMGFMPKRIIPDPNESEKEAFKRLMKENRFNKVLSNILTSSEEKISLHIPERLQVDLTQKNALGVIPYTGGTRYKKKNRCLEGTRVDIMKNIIKHIDNEDGAYNEKRLFLLTGVAGSGKSTIAHSIALHYDERRRLGSSFFFSEADKESSQAHNLFRNIARDLADYNTQFRIKLCDIVANNTTVSTTKSVQEQFQHLVMEIMHSIVLEYPIVIVIDALDECDKGGNSRVDLLDVLAKEMTALPSHFRIFVAARPVSDILKVFGSSPYVQHFTMDSIDSNGSDIQTFFHHKLSHEAEKLAAVDPNWLQKLTKMAGGLFIYADVACRYILKDEIREPWEKFQNMTSIIEEAEHDSPIPYLYKLYTKVLDDIVDLKNLASIRERLKKVLGMVLLAYEPLSSSDINQLFGPNDNAARIIGRMGTLLNGVGDPLVPVQPLHASFGEFLRDEKLNESFYIDPQKQHGEIAKKCLEIMNNNLKFDIFDFKNGFVPTSDDYSERRIASAVKEWRTLISKALQYSCKYWPIHITQMSKGELRLIQEPLRRFLFEEKQLMRWIEVISVMDMEQVYEIRNALLSLYNWLEGINPLDERIRKLIWECYHLLRCFWEPITSGPLQLYISALPYVPSESILHKFYKDQVILPPDFLIGSIQNVKLLAPTFQDDVLHRFQLLFYEFSVLAFSRDGTRIAAILEDTQRLNIFDFEAFALIDGSIELHGEYELIAFSPDGLKIVVAGARNFEVWSLIERRVLVQKKFATKAKIEAVAFPSNSRVLCCNRTGGGLQFLELEISPGEEGKDTTSFAIHVGENIICVAMSPDASHVCGISKSNKLSVWNTGDHSTVVNGVDLGNEGTEGSFNRLTISCDGEYIACGSDTGTVRLWNSRSASFVWSGKVGNSIKQILMPFQPENKQLVIVSESGSGGSDVQVWDTLTGSYYKHEARSAAAMSPDGKYIMTIWGEVWAIEANNPVPETRSDKAILHPGEKLKEVVFLEDGRLIAGGAGGEKRDVVVWEKLGHGAATSQTLKIRLSDSDPKPDICFLRFSPDGRRLIAVSRNQRPGDHVDRATEAFTVHLWCRDGDDIKFSLRKTHTLGSTATKFEPMNAVSLVDGRILVAAVNAKVEDDERRIYLWDDYGSKYESKQVLKACTSYIDGIDLSPNGRRLVSWTSEEVLLWSREGAGLEFTLQERYKADKTKWDDDVINEITYKWFHEVSNSPEGSLSHISKSQDISNPGQVHRPFTFTFDTQRFREEPRWVLANDRKLWFIPRAFSGRHRMVQKGRKAVVYGDRFALLFEYKDGVFPTILNE